MGAGLRRSVDHSRWQRPERASIAIFHSLPGVYAMLVKRIPEQSKTCILTHHCFRIAASSLQVATQKSTLPFRQMAFFNRWFLASKGNSFEKYFDNCHAGAAERSFENEE